MPWKYLNKRQSEYHKYSNSKLDTDQDAQEYIDDPNNLNKPASGKKKSEEKLEKAKFKISKFSKSKTVA